MKKKIFLIGALAVALGAAAYLVRPLLQAPPAVASSKKTNPFADDHAHHMNHAAEQNSVDTKTVVTAPTPPVTEKYPGMIWIPGATYARGCFGCDMTDALPLHRVQLDGFWLDETPITNAEYEKFVKETSYKTIAERPLNPKDYPDVPKDKLVAGSAVFAPPSATAKVSLHEPLSWWRYQAGASWKNPEGPGTNISKRLDHPAVHIAYDDAVAYCNWAQKRLPTEAEYEFAARGGLEGKTYSWGDELTPDGKWQSNIWQGTFPNAGEAKDGFLMTSPVKAFPGNGYGLRDMSGNVWQWVSDWYRADYYQDLVAKGTTPVNPQGPADSLDPEEPGVPKRVQKGGSFLCSDQYCTRYIVGTRGKGSPDSAGSNIGFRCARN